jgi:tetratricopeptide (TPR) repeat protein
MPITPNARGLLLAFFTGAIAILAGCQPSGPKALLEGEDFIKKGDYPQAIKRLERATQALPQTPQVWNHLGLAYHGNGNVAEAASAYQRAINLDRNLAPAYFNLGNLYLEQNKLPESISALSTFTVLEPKNPEGWIKLGAAQLRARRPDDAEKALARALALAPRDPEIQNNLGLAHLARRRPREAMQAFNQALQFQNNYPPAILNEAIVSQYHLGNKAAALNLYRRYVAVHPDGSQEIQKVIQQLGDELAPRPVPAAPQIAQASPPPQNDRSLGNPRSEITAPTKTGEPSPKTIVEQPEPADITASTSRIVVPNLSTNREKAVATRTEPPKANPPSSEKAAPKQTAPIVAVPAPPAPRVDPSLTNIPVIPPVQVASVSEEPVVRAAQDIPARQELANVGRNEIADKQPAVQNEERRPLLAPRQPERKGLLEKMNPTSWLRPGREKALPKSFSAASTPAPVTPVQVDEPPRTEPIPQRPASVATRPVPRYPYRKNLVFRAGNRSEAQPSFSQAILAHQEHRWAAAIELYKKALLADPGFFEARYNLALAAYESGDLPLALASSEEAIALKPGSIDTRYNFALALRDANYFADAADQLRQLLVDAPDEVRAQYTLANLYAQQLDLSVLAARHYQKVLELDPRHPEAQKIRLWLSSRHK